MIKPTSHDKYEEQINETKTYFQRCKSWIKSLDEEFQVAYVVAFVIKSIKFHMKLIA